MGTVPMALPGSLPVRVYHARGGGLALKTPATEERRSMQYAFVDCVLDTERRELRRASMPVKNVKRCS
jgi:hypothetical protein